MVGIEVCCYSIESALAAQQGGADRIELCDNLFEGGTTPSYGIMKTVRQKVNTDLFAMIRPRGGDFNYSQPELESMFFNIKLAKELGLNGVVLGVLNVDGTFDLEVMKRLIEAARPLEVTIHRSFDLTIDPFQALEDAIDLGVNRILTSGQKNIAYDGIPLIRSLNEIAGDKLSIMPGSGINENNICEIIAQTGVKEFHVSARSARPSSMQYQNQYIALGDPRFSEYSIDVADPQRIRKYRGLTKSLVSS